MYLQQALSTKIKENNRQFFKFIHMYVQETWNNKTSNGTSTRNPKPGFWKSHGEMGFCKAFKQVEQGISSFFCPDLSWHI